MSDRSNVYLTVLNEHADQVLQLFAHTIQGSEKEDHLCIFEMGEKSYGQLDGLKKLEAAGIAYDSSWDAEFEYEEGVSSLRFKPNGEAAHFTIYESAQSIRIATLMTMINDFDTLASFILEADKGITVPSWDNQLEYAKLFRAQQLIAPTAPVTPA